MTCGLPLLAPGTVIESVCAAAPLFVTSPWMALVRPSASEVALSVTATDELVPAVWLVITREPLLASA